MRRRRTAHRFGDRRRTTDVLTEETLDFSGLMLSSAVLEGLKSAGFERPSPIQLKAIPLGRCGLDLIAQAKSGTGKTCVFSVIALENVNLTVASIQILVLAPTREIAVQIKDVVCSIGRHMEGLCVHVFIGGMPVEEDKRHLKQCHIAVGTPGRVKQLIENKFLKPDSIRLFILDEADKLLDDNFQSQTNWIFSTLPVSKQMLALSATYTDRLAQHLRNYMKDPTFVRLNASDPALEGIRHYRSVVPYHSLPHQVFQEKVKTLLTLLSKLPFHQCLIFSNYQIRARNLSETLSKNGWPATYISGSQGQNERLKAMDKLKEFKCRILISTDLTSRGIDAERVNLVINMDVPRDSETYLHRVGRAGRFGSYGAAVNFVAEGKEVASLNEIETGCGVVIDLLPENISQLLSEPVPCNGKQPISSITTCIGSPEEVVGPVDGGTTERSAGFREINGDTIETEGNAGGERSGKEEEAEMKVGRRGDVDEHGSSVVPEEEKEAFENGASAERQAELFEGKPDINKTIDNAGSRRHTADPEGITDIELVCTPPEDIGEESEDHICYPRVLAGKHGKNEAKEASCSAVAVEKPGNKEFQQNPCCHLGTFGNRRGRSECLLENSQNGEHAEKCLSDTACFGVLREEGNLGKHGEDKEHVREHCDPEEHIEKYRDTKELPGEHRDTEEQLREHCDPEEHIEKYRDTKELPGEHRDTEEQLREHCDQKPLEPRVDTKELPGEHRDTEEQLRERCGTEEHRKEFSDAKELLGDRREAKEYFEEPCGTKEDHGERPRAKEHHEEQFDKTKHPREHRGTEEHIRDNRDNKGHLEGLCNNNVQFKMNDAAGFSEDIGDNEDEELQRRALVMPWEKLSKVEFFPPQNGTGRFSEVESTCARSSENQSCVEPIIEEHLGGREIEGEFSENSSLGCGARNRGEYEMKLENSFKFNGKCFDGSNAMMTNPVLFHRPQTEGASFGIESTWLPSGLGGSESPCSEETVSKDSCFVGSRSESSCSDETGSERSCSGKTTSEGSSSEGSSSEETESESSGIERSNDRENVPMSGEDFDNVLESYLQTRASEKPSTVRTRSEELSENDVATESWTTPIEPPSQSKGTKTSDGQTEAVPPIVIDKPHAHQCTGIDRDQNDVIETLPRVSRDAPSAALGSSPELAGLQGGEQGSEGAVFHGATAEEDTVSGYLSTLPAEWKRVWYEAYERQTKLISTYAEVYRNAFY